MITSRRILERLLATTFLAAGLLSSPFTTSMAFSGQTQRLQSAAATWSDGDAQREPLPLESPVIQSASFQGSCDGDCGPVCDCGQSDAVCGAEWIEQADPACGLEVEGECECDACTGVGVDRHSTGAHHRWQLPLCIPKLSVDWHSFDFFYGHQGYTGPLNYVRTSSTSASSRSGSGSFGFYQGFNKGTSLDRWLGLDLAGQLGVRATQSNFSGGGFTRERRYQVFVTTGLFRRVDYGLQYGLVLDYFNQDWYFQSDALQLRGELSWRLESSDTVGVQFMSGVRNETSGTVINTGAATPLVSTIRLEPTDQYRLFYRCSVLQTGQCQGFVGWTDQDDALLGSNLSVHLFPRILLATDLTYLIPTEGRSSGGNEQESWNVAIGFVFRPGGNNGHRRYNLPMFDVADNGTFMIDRR
jgi:hypothetical protein